MGNEEERDALPLQGNLEKGLDLLRQMQEEHAALQEQDKLLDKNFKKEFPGLGFHQLDSLYKLYKKRPKVVVFNLDIKKYSFSTDCLACPSLRAQVVL